MKLVGTQFTVVRRRKIDKEQIMEWTPATIEDVKQIIEADLDICDEEEVEMFESFAVDPYHAPVIRDGKTESVVVVARKGDAVIYWEDVEEGFNVSPVDANGLILEHGCDQDELGTALNNLFLR
jgi:hypothetical protein